MVLVTQFVPQFVPTQPSIFRCDLTIVNEENLNAPTTTIIEKTKFSKDTSSGQTEPQSSSTSGPQLASRPYTLKPPVTAELLFVLPSLSLRITTDQRQSLSRPTLSDLPQIEELNDDDDNNNAQENTKPATTDASWTPLSPAKDLATKSRLLWSSFRPFIVKNQQKSQQGLFIDDNVVKISFQTDFHGCVQLGIIDVPWLPTLIMSYLYKNVNDYEGK